MQLDQIVARNAQRFPHRAALICGDVSRTWSELEHRVDALSRALVGVGLMPGDRLAILLGNRPEYFELYFACARSGILAVPLNYRLTAAELATVLRHAEPAACVTEAVYAESLAAVRGELPSLRQVWLLERDYRSFSKGSSRLPADGSPTNVSAPSDDRSAIAIFYTSGTTGLPKGAMVSHRNLIHNGYNQLIADAARADDVVLLATPLYHLGAVFMAITYMMNGCTQVILPQFTPRAWLETAVARAVTASLLVSTMINAILNEPQFDHYDLRKLRLIFYGGGPMPPAVLRRAIERLPCNFTQGYGLTETLEASFLVAADHRLRPGDQRQLARLASAGREAIGAEIRIVDASDRNVPNGEIGEVLIRSESVISSYWRQPEETAHSIRDGWFYTGDLGYLDDERYLFLVDRKKDMVVSGGVNVYTKEIEAVLFTHPAVAEAAVFGMPDEHWGEAVCAAIVLRPGQEVNADALGEHCKAQLAGFKKPRRYFFVAELPKNPSGKVLKRELRQNLAAR
jgi:acyl-CoA synthetase (AMP-forming)/AMP-acid ligase II